MPLSPDVARMKRELATLVSIDAHHFDFARTRIAKDIEECRTHLRGLLNITVTPFKSPG